jgi:carbonic anhydrase/acetyltransferase-like protein (isoleucine patch superfamily)
MNDIIQYLKDKYAGTCSVFNPKHNHITFANDLKNLNSLRDFAGKLCVLVPETLDAPKWLSDEIEIIRIKKDLFYTFVLVHNYINESFLIPKDIIGEDCRIHKTAVIGVDGHNIAEASDGSRLLMSHIGNVKLGDRVSIDAYSVIHRSIFGSTIIGNDSIICAHVNVGHNCTIGDRVFIAPGVKIAGSVNIGRNCFIWQGSLIRNGINICENVTIGMGSIVIKDILEPGVYYGQPCKKVGT